MPSAEAVNIIHDLLPGFGVPSVEFSSAVDSAESSMVLDLVCFASSFIDSFLAEGVFFFLVIFSGLVDSSLTEDAFSLFSSRLWVLLPAHWQESIAHCPRFDQFFNSGRGVCAGRQF